jgi:ribosomal-protein-alanine N-acetyltransferase
VTPVIETPRLLLRSFRDGDAGDVYNYAKDPRVGPIAGWPPHKSVEESREIIRTVFSLPGVFAMEVKADGCAAGSVGFVGRHPAGERPDCPDNEIGYGLNPDYWGRGLMPEAVEAVLRYGFTVLGYKRIWCGHYAGNWRSKRVISKCGFHYQFSCTEEVEEMGEIRQTYHYMQTMEEWCERVLGTL